MQDTNTNQAGGASGQQRGVSAATIQSYLKNVDYPATKEQLADRARQAGAPEQVVQRIAQLPAQQFAGPQEVARAFGEETAPAGGAPPEQRERESA